MGGHSTRSTERRGTTAEAGERTPPDRSRAALLAIVALVAFAARLTPVLRGGGLGSHRQYDDGVYFAAADALTFGLVPYRDFVLLHPPGITVVLVPFALLGRLTSDAVGMGGARVAFMAVGALNAVLVAALALRWRATAAVVAGGLYALWRAAVESERTVLLEPLGTTATLAALHLLLGARRSPRAEIAAGAVLGLAVTLKIWYVVPWAVIVVWHVRQRRTAARVLAGGLAAMGSVLIPFVALAGRRMYEMVIAAQVGRPPFGGSALERVPRILGLPGAPTIAAGAAVLLVLAAARCWPDRRARLVVAILAANLVVLLASPGYFDHYSALVAAPAAVVLAVGLGAPSLRPPGLARPVWLAAVPTVALVGATLSGQGVTVAPHGAPVSGWRLAAAAPPGCIATDDPQILIQMDRLSRSFELGCPMPVDVTGTTFHSLRHLGADGRPVRRRCNPAWNAYLYDYFVSADAFVLVRTRPDGALSSETVRALTAFPVVAASHGLVMRSARNEPAPRPAAPSCAAGR
ncbi:MAG TPA: hypothetical protein VFO65_13795 [Acidimicrobiales bacterium]|nr:hypothetical protein [Acidimicrobiales bacterium]